MNQNHGYDFIVRMAVFYAALFLIYGIHLPYFPVWLESRGLTPEQISWVIAAPLFARIVITPAIAAAMDRVRAHRGGIRLLACATLAATLVLTQLTSFWSIAVGAMLLAIAFTSMMPLAETISFAGVRASKLDYGRMRLWGSATFILASFIGGAFVDHYGEGIGIWLLCVASAATLATSLVLPKPVTNGPTPAVVPPRHHEGLIVRANSRGEPHGASRKKLNPYATLTPIFALFLICAGFSQASHATYYTFGTLLWLDQGFSPFWIGVLWALGVIAEIALFMYSRAVVNAVGPVALMITGAAAGVLRWLAMAFEPNLVTLVPLQILHGLTYGATHLGAVHFIANTVPESRSATAQALYGAMGNGIAMGAATLMSGWLFATLGVGTYLAMAGVSFAALLAGLLVLRQTNT